MERKLLGMDDLACSTRFRIAERFGSTITRLEHASAVTARHFAQRYVLLMQRLTRIEGGAMNAL